MSPGVRGIHHVVHLREDLRQREREREREIDDEKKGIKEAEKGGEMMI